MEPDDQQEHQQLLTRRERLRAERQAAHSAPARIRLRMGAVVVILAALLSWLAISWLSSPSTSGESLPQPTAATSAQPPADDSTAPKRQGNSQAQLGPETQQPAVIVVHVAGAVTEPQVVELQQGDRTGDAVDAAGGLTGDAAAAGVNLAAEAVDGSFIWVPTVEEFESGESGPPTAGQQGARDEAEAPVDLNAAGAEQLQQLSGIGPALAERIITYREENGEFRSLEELAGVSGIGPAIIEDIGDDVDW